MTTICGSIDIGRPVEEVFDTVCDQRNELRCDPIDGGTRFSWQWHVTVPWPARLAGLLVRRIGERREREIWSGLKRFLEGRPS